MKYVIATNVTEAKALRRILRKLFGIPAAGRRGKHVGGGIHVDLDDGSKRGWTLWAVNYRKHPTEQKWAVPITARVKAMWAAHKSRLTAAERQGVLAAITAEQDLDPSWTPTPI